MKYFSYLVLVCSIAIFTSCKKDDSIEGQDGLVKTIDSIAMNPQIGLISLDDGNFIIVTNNELVKLDDQGKMIWRKPVTEISDIRAAVAEPGTGLVLFGVPVNPPTMSSFYACRYDTDGNLLDTKQVNTNFPNSYAENPVSIIRLANGGFAIAMPSSLTWCTYLKILDRDFNLIYSKVMTHPVQTEYYTFLVQNICELPGGDIALAATVNYGDFVNVWMNAAVVLTGPDGTTKSLVLMGDSVVNQIAHVMSPCAGGFFTVSSTKTGWYSTNGAFVNYYSGTQIAGTMQIDRFNSEGQFIGSHQLTGYSGYGVIHSIRKTSDGGYPLCGTVDNNGSSYSVSMTKVFLCRLDAGLNELWSKTFNTNYQTIGSDAVSTSDGGYLVAGNMKSFGDDYQLLMIRTDANGNY